MCLFYRFRVIRVYWSKICIFAFLPTHSRWRPYRRGCHDCIVYGMKLGLEILESWFPNQDFKITIFLTSNNLKIIHNITIVKMADQCGNCGGRWGGGVQPPVNAFNPPIVVLLYLSWGIRNNPHRSQLQTLICHHIPQVIEPCHCCQADVPYPQCGKDASCSCNAFSQNTFWASADFSCIKISMYSKSK